MGVTQNGWFIRENPHMYNYVHIQIYTQDTTNYRMYMGVPVYGDKTRSIFDLMEWGYN